jgi:serine/threonine protein kinase
VHRDLKPGNVILTRSGAKLLDFGLARATGLSESPGSGLTKSPTLTRPLTAEGTIVGTFQYMAPEQLEGKDADARTDIFAFGAVLYEMVTGTRAFEGESQASLIASIIKEQPRPMSEIVPLTPPALEHIVRRSLAKKPDERWQSAFDVKHQLEWIRNAGSQAGVPAPVAVHRRHLTRALWITSVVSTVAALALLSWMMTHRPLPRRRCASASCPRPATSSPSRKSTWRFRRMEARSRSSHPTAPAHRNYGSAVSTRLRRARSHVRSHRRNLSGRRMGRI